MENLNDIETTLYFTNQRAELAGYILKISRYEKSIMVGNRKTRRMNRDEKEEPTREKLTAEEIRVKSVRRAKRKIVDLVNSNVWQWNRRNGYPYNPIFITFTFGENIVDLDSANKEFKNFMKRLSYENWGLNVNTLKYLAVPEFQERGAIHYHVIFFNLPFMERIYDRMFSIWGHGFTWIKSIRSEKGIARYLCKYLTKNIEEGKLQARKSYFASKNLKKPIVVNIEEIVNLIKRKIPSEIKGRCYSYESEFLMNTEVFEYNLKQYPEVLNDIHKEIIDKFL